jgi:RimJ/RimL family protein N-acetyltransferase
MSRRLDHAPIFGSGTFRAMELQEQDIPALQEFFDANPEYFLAVTGQPPEREEGHEEFHDEVPDGMPYTRKWMIGFVDESDCLIGMASVISDLLAKHVWHIGLFVVATSLHGSGAAGAMHGQLETWMRGHGAQWIRLGVVEGNARAERFWERAGYREVRKRRGVEMGARINVIRVMVKPLAAGTLVEYLARVARDRPE